nr:SDR family oxidoreductase [Acetobacter persici]
MTNLAGKIVAITGASSGIGEAAARHLAQQGAKVVLAARRFERLESIVAAIKADGGEASAIPTDVTHPEDLQKLVKHAIDEHGRLDVMVNNAGLGAVAPISALLIDEWDRMIDINLKGLLYGVAAALPVFEAQGSGHFVNIASVAGFNVQPNAAVYSGTKFAVRAISEGLRQELGRVIRTTIISPGAIATELGNGTTHEESVALLSNFAGIAISPDAIARAIAFAIGQPSDVDVSEIVVRPVAQEF